MDRKGPPVIWTFKLICVFSCTVLTLHVPQTKQYLVGTLQSTIYLLGALIENSKPTTQKNRENSNISIRIIFFLGR